MLDAHLTLIPRGICCWPLEALVVSKRPGEVLDI